MIFTVCTYIFWAGNTIVASPLCTPAFSICSLIREIMTSPSLAIPSHSISFASRINFEITTGKSVEISFVRDK